MYLMIAFHLLLSSKNLIILSKCIDFISTRTSGAIGVFILSKGFRNYNVYNLGYYK